MIYTCAFNAHKQSRVIAGSTSAEAQARCWEIEEKWSEIGEQQGREGPTNKDSYHHWRIWATGFI